MQYKTYYEEKNTVTVGKYQQMRQAMTAGDQQCRAERYTLRKLKFIGGETRAFQADYALCVKDGDENQIFLEKKYVQNGVYFRSIQRVTKEECDQILEGQLEWMKSHRCDLLADFYLQVTLNHLSPGYLTEYDRELIQCRKGNAVVFCRKVQRAVGITNRLFDEPEIMIPCLDEGKVLVTYKKSVKLPVIFSRLFTGQEENLGEGVFLSV